MLRSFPEGGNRWQVSQGGGTGPRWSPKGDELFYFTGSELRAVPIGAGGEPTPATPRTVSAWSARRMSYDVAADGRVLALRGADPPGTEPEQGIVIVEGWLERLASGASP
jgi:hypothetical protein